jgi:hypothetical protein
MNPVKLKALQATRAEIFKDIEALRKKHGVAALPAMRRYLSDLAERSKRLEEIKRLKSELSDLNKNKRVWR